MKTILAIFASIMLFAGCSSKTEPTNTQTSNETTKNVIEPKVEKEMIKEKEPEKPKGPATIKDIIGYTYQLEGTIPNTMITLSFQAESLAGSSGVNSYFADYKINGNQITLSHAGVTKMMGPPTFMKQEDEFIKNLNEFKTILISEDGSTITIETNSKKKLVFAITIDTFAD